VDLSLSSTGNSFTSDEIDLDVGPWVLALGYANGGAGDYGISLVIASGALGSCVIRIMGLVATAMLVTVIAGFPIQFRTFHRRKHD